MREALAAEADALARCEVRTLAEARDRARQRQADENAAKLAEQMLRSLAPSGVEALDQALADARETIKGVSDTPVRAVEQVASELEAAETREAELARPPARRRRGGGRCAGKGGVLRSGPRCGARPAGDGPRRRRARPMHARRGRASLTTPRKAGR